MNHLIRVLVAVTAVGGGFVACSNNPGSEPATGDTELAHAHSRPAPWALARQHVGNVMRVCSDGQIAGIVAALNESEITESQAVLDRLSNKDVRDFAQMLIDDHTKALQKGQTVFAQLNIQVEETDNRKELLQGAKLFVQAAQSLESAELDRTFVAHQIMGHLKGLAVIDGLLLTSAKQSDMRALLQDARAMVAMHLEDAITLQARIVGSCGGESSADAGTDAGTGTNTDSGEACDDAGQPSEPSNPSHSW
jgi:putative membrane protein